MHNVFFSRRRSAAAGSADGVRRRGVGRATGLPSATRSRARPSRRTSIARVRSPSRQAPFPFRCAPVLLHRLFFLVSSFSVFFRLFFLSFAFSYVLFSLQTSATLSQKLLQMTLEPNLCWRNHMFKEECVYLRVFALPLLCFTSLSNFDSSQVKRSHFLVGCFVTFVAHNSNSQMHQLGAFCLLRCVWHSFEWLIHIWISSMLYSWNWRKCEWVKRTPMGGLRKF